MIWTAVLVVTFLTLDHLQQMNLYDTRGPYQSLASCMMRGEQMKQDFADYIDLLLPDEDIAVEDVALAYECHGEAEGEEV